MQRLVALGQQRDRGAQQLADLARPAAGGVDHHVALEHAGAGPEAVAAVETRWPSTATPGRDAAALADPVREQEQYRWPSM